MSPEDDTTRVLNCAKRAIGETDAVRKADCERCCHAEYGLPGTHRAHQSVWVCHMACTDLKTPPKQRRNAPPMNSDQRVDLENEGTRAHGRTLLDNGLLSWPVADQCMLRAHDTARTRTTGLV